MSSKAVQRCRERALKSICAGLSHDPCLLVERFRPQWQKVALEGLDCSRGQTAHPGFWSREDGEVRRTRRTRPEDDPLRLDPLKSNLHHRSQPSQKQETENIPRTGLSSLEKSTTPVCYLGEVPGEIRKEQPGSRKQLG